MAKSFDDLTAQEKCDVLKKAATELVYALYYEQDKENLKDLGKALTETLKQIRDCVTCLDFLKNQGGTFEKINLLIEFLGHEKLDEDFVKQLEDLASHARSCIEEGTRDLTAEARAIRYWQQVSNRDAAEYEMECKARDEQEASAQ